MQQLEIMALDQDGVCVACEIVTALDLEATQLAVARRHPDHAIVVRPLDQHGARRDENLPLSKRERIKSWDDFIG